MSDLIVRTVTPADVESTRDVVYRTWLATYVGMDGVTEDDIKSRFAERAKPENISRLRMSFEKLPDDQRFFVAEFDGNVVGICRLFLHSNKNQLQAIYVLPKFQGKGVGKALWLEAQAHLNFALPTFVEVVAKNANAIAFYKRLGFKETGRTWSDERFRMKSGAIFVETELVMEPKK